MMFLLKFKKTSSSNSILRSSENIRETIEKASTLWALFFWPNFRLSTSFGNSVLNLSRGMKAEGAKRWLGVVLNKASLLENLGELVLGHLSNAAAYNPP